jgi:hypothetical protein
MEAPVGAGLNPAPTPEKLAAAKYPGIATPDDYYRAERLLDQQQPSQPGHRVPPGASDNNWEA